VRARYSQPNSFSRTALLMWSASRPTFLEPIFDWPQPFIEALPTRLLLLQQNQQQSRPRWLQSFNGPLEIAGLAPDEAHAPLFRLFYQVEIRHHPIPSSKIRNPRTAADAPDSTTRLWQSRGCYVEIAGLPAAFG